MAYEVINFEFLKDLKRKGNRSVIDFFIEMQLIASGFECPTCKIPMRRVTQQNKRNVGLSWSCPLYSDGNYYGHHRSVTSGSWFDGIRSTPIDMLICIYLWVRETTIERLSEELQRSKGTIQSWISRCRDVCVEIVVQENVILGGPGVIVEIYEAKFVKTTSYIPRITGEWVYLVAERGTNKCFVQVKESLDNTVLLNILYKRVLPGTIIVCYGWNAYDCYHFNQHKLNLERNNNLTFTEEELEPATGVNFWSLFKKYVYGCKTEYKFDSTVAEFMWRHFYQFDYQVLLRSFLMSISCDRWQEN